MRQILGGRFTIVIFTSTFALAAATLFLTLQFTENKDARRMFINAALKYYVLAMQIVDFTLLTCSIVIIFIYLSRQEAASEDARAFRREKRTLLTILLIFDSTYILRAIYDVLYVKQENQYGMAWTIAEVMTGNIFDLVPICCILFIHTQNF